jgi:hypothetical protein
MERNMVIRKLHDRRDTLDDYVRNPEEGLDILERLRKEAESFIYGNATTFQRTVTIVRRIKG